MNETNTIEQTAKRKLASVQKITSISLIEGADRIEVAQVLGWQVVIKKGQFQVGDIVIYLEVDSLLPDMDWSSFLKNEKHPDKAIRLKTIRLRGQISQGLIVPLAALLDYIDDDSAIKNSNLRIGDDLTERMGITKYVPYIPAQLSGQVRGAFPFIVPKTDELRIQSYPELLEEFAGREVYITTKVDGSSGTFIMNDGDFQVCSRNWSLYEDEGNSFWQVAKDNQLCEKLGEMGNYAIQGEVAGPGIQKNHLNLDKAQLFVFNIYDINKRQFLDYANFVHFCEELELQTVPVDMVAEFNPDWTIEYLLKLCQGSYVGTKNPREGIVIRPTDGFYSQVINGRASFKVINNDFLLKGGD